MIMHNASSFLRRLLAVVSILLLVLFATPWHLSFGQDEDVNRVLQNLVTRVEAAPSGHAQVESVTDMLDYVAKLKKSAIAAIDDQTIDRIAELLRDPSDYVRSYAVYSLQHFGARSRRALPALRHALSEAERQLEAREAKEFIIVHTGSPPMTFTLEEAIYLIENPEKSRSDYLQEKYGNENTTGRYSENGHKRKTGTRKRGTKKGDTH